MAAAAETTFLVAAGARLSDALAGLARWAEAATTLERPWSAGLALAGLALLLVGARLRPVAAGVAGAAVGALAGLAGAAAIASAWPVSTPLALAAAGGASLGLLSAAIPPVGAAAIGALPGALLGALVPFGEQPWIGAALGAAALGSVTLAAARLATTGAVALVGAAMITLGALGLMPGRALAADLARRPVALVALMGVLAVAGAAFQLGRPRRPARTVEAPPRRPADEHDEA